MSHPNNENFQAPPPPPFAEPASATGPTMSTGETLTGIFFEPGRTFESLRARPRFLVAALIIVVAFFAFYISYLQRVGYENVVRAELDISAQASNMSSEDRQQAIDIQMSPFVKAIRYGAPIVTLAIFFAVGAALYLLGATIMARSISYKQALSVWTYSSYPPTMLMMLANIVLLFVNPPEDDAAIVRGQNGLVHTNLSLLVDPTLHPVLATALGAFDVFAFYGLFLAALGLRKVARLSAGAAWAIVIVIWLLGVIMRVALAAITGRAM